MYIRRAFAFRDLLALIGFMSVVGCVLAGMAPEPGGLPARTLENLRNIAQAAHMYRAANNDFLPITLTYTPRGTAPGHQNTLAGWCTWSFGGKNNNSYWYNAFGGIFDVEAADRPLNAYLIPEEPFYAPPPPQRLPANDPARTSAQAEMCHDPSDTKSFQRNWPNPTTTISGYDDVGTSYLTNMGWWDQLANISDWGKRMSEGARRIATENGATPSRFVWLTDQYGDILASHPNRRFRIRNGYGDWNFAPLLFLDGHVTYEYITPTVLTTQTYTFQFE